MLDLDIKGFYDNIAWSGQFEYLDRAQAKLRVVVPFTLLVIFVLLFFTFRSIDEALIVMATLPFALLGGFWYIYLQPAQRSCSESRRR